MQGWQAPRQALGPTRLPQLHAADDGAGDAEACADAVAVGAGTALALAVARGGAVAVAVAAGGVGSGGGGAALGLHPSSPATGAASQRPRLTAAPRVWRSG